MFITDYAHLLVPTGTADSTGIEGYVGGALKQTKRKQEKILQISRFSAKIHRIFGATDPIRTDDLLITSELLYRLSHSSKY